MHYRTNGCLGMKRRYYFVIIFLLTISNKFITTIILPNVLYGDKQLSPNELQQNIEETWVPPSIVLNNQLIIALAPPNITTNFGFFKASFPVLNTFHLYHWNLKMVLTDNFYSLLGEENLSWAVSSMNTNFVVFTLYILPISMQDNSKIVFTNGTTYSVGAFDTSGNKLNYGGFSGATYGTYTAFDNITFGIDNNYPAIDFYGYYLIDFELPFSNITAQQLFYNANVNTRFNFTIFNTIVYENPIGKMTTLQLNATSFFHVSNTSSSTFMTLYGNSLSGNLVSGSVFNNVRNAQFVGLFLLEGGELGILVIIIYVNNKRKITRLLSESDTNN